MLPFFAKAGMMIEVGMEYEYTSEKSTNNQ
jgi:hypothetical protein